MRDPIAPAWARDPVEAIELVCIAISDGDLEAAVAQYERGAVLVPWEHKPQGSDLVEARLNELMELRLPLIATVRAVLPAGGLALVLCDRRISGTGPDSKHVELCGLGATVVRRQPGGGWRIAADAWRLADTGDAHADSRGPVGAQPAFP